MCEYAFYMHSICNKICTNMQNYGLPDREYAKKCNKKMQKYVEKSAKNA